MKKKIIGILVCMLLIATGLPVIGTMNSCRINLVDINGNKVMNNVMAYVDDQLDQEAPDVDLDGVWIGPGSMFATGFTPSLGILTRVQVHLNRVGNPSGNLVCGIRSLLTGSDVTSLSILATNVPNSNSWFEFDFSDINVNPGQTYFIVLYAPGNNWGVSDRINWWSSLNPGDPWSFWGGAWHDTGDESRTFKSYGCFDHKTEKAQLPDLSSAGTDLCMKGDVYPSAALADDFMCIESGPITNIHLWGSFDTDVLPDGGVDSLTFQITIYDNAGDEPGAARWQEIFNPGEYSAKLYHESWQCWYCPWTEWFHSHNHKKTYQYDFLIDTDDAFNQEEGTIYWLGLRWIHGVADYAFGWKTTTLDLRWKEPAHKFDEGEWIPLEYPPAHQHRYEKINLAFVIGAPMKLTSPAFEDGEIIPGRYTSNLGEEYWGISPPLTISSVPSNAESLVLIMDDEYPLAEGWVHWIVYDIPAATISLPEKTGAEGDNGLPEGARHGTNELLQRFYHGPDPPYDRHTYCFRLYALDITLGALDHDTKQDLLEAMEKDDHIIQTAELRGTYNNEDNQPPTVEITLPEDGATVSGTISIQGTASDSDGFITYVQLSIADIIWQLIYDATPSWTTSWDTTMFVNDGPHTISAQSRDHRGVFSTWDTITVIVNNDGTNRPPNTPSVPSGPATGRINTVYTYSTSTTDPDGDQIQYLFDWGDGTDSGWTDPVASGQIASETHTWTVQDDYQIKVRARDTNLAESEWSDPLSVSMPRNKPYINTLFLQFLEQYPLLYQLLLRFLRL